jgi:hypothetical protein
MIGKHLRSPLRNELRLILHILAASGNEEQSGGSDEGGDVLRDSARGVLKGHGFSRAISGVRK